MENLPKAFSGWRLTQLFDQVGPEGLVKETANVLFTSTAFVSKIRRLYRQRGEVNRKRRKGRQRILSCVDRLCALVLRSKLIIFPLFEVEQSLQLHQSIHKLLPQNSISSSICWCMKWLVAKRPKLIVLLF